MLKTKYKLKINKIRLEIKEEYFVNTFSLVNIFSLRKNTSIKIVKRHKKIQNHKAKIRGKIREKLQSENKSKNILKPKVQGANPVTNHIKIADLKSFLQFFSTIFLFFNDLAIKKMLKNTKIITENL